LGGRALEGGYTIEREGRGPKQSWEGHFIKKGKEGGILNHDPKGK